MSWHLIKKKQLEVSLAVLKDYFVKTHFDKLSVTTKFYNNNNNNNNNTPIIALRQAQCD